MQDRQLSDKLTFRNHKGEEKTITREEFRNAARGQQHIDHRPKEEIRDYNYHQAATPESMKFDLVKVNGKDI